MLVDSIIDEHRIIHAGEYPAGLRLMAIFGVCPTMFGGNGVANSLARSAWMWVVRLPDGTLGSICHLVTLDPTPRSQVRVLAASLSGDMSLLDGGHFTKGGVLVGRSCIITVRRQACGGSGRDRPVVPSAKPLTEGVEPVVMEDACLWTTKSRKPFPTYAPQWVHSYADAAFVLEKERKGVTP